MVRSFRKSSIIFCLVSCLVFAGSDEESFLRGNKLYDQHNYDAALASYDMIAHKGRAVLYNMGNCYYHKNNYSQALLYWTRAERGATAAEVGIIAHNKQQMLQKMGKNNDVSRTDRMWYFFYSFLPYFSLFCLQLLFLLCWYLLMFCVYKNGRTKKMLSGGVLVIVMLIASTLGVHCIQKSIETGIVIKKQVACFVGPNKDFHRSCSLDYTDHVVVKEKREGWYKVQYSGNIGWVEADAIQIV